MSGNDEVRSQLLDAARHMVRAKGYVGVSVRGAAAAAGVAPEVARRYYNNRDELFAAAMKLPFDPAAAVPSLVAPGIEGMGERLVSFTLQTLGDPQARDELFALVQAGASAGKAVEGLVDFIEQGVVDRVARAIGVPDARMRAALVTSQLVGMAMVRYGMRLEPLASASDEDVIRMIAPHIQDLLDPRKPIPGYKYPPKGATDALPAQAVKVGKEAATQASKQASKVAGAAIGGVRGASSAAARSVQRKPGEEAQPHTAKPQTATQSPADQDEAEWIQGEPLIPPAQDPPAQNQPAQNQPEAEAAPDQPTD